MTTDQPASDKLTRGILLLVMVAALAVGTWSIYTLLTDRFHAPRQIAFFGCAMFDAAALFFARLAQKYATSPDSGLAPRLAMLATTTASAWTNWTHAKMEGWGTVGGVVLGSAPVIAEIAFELHHRYENREALRRRGRVPAALPVLGKWAWLLYGRTAFRAMRSVVGTHLRTTAADAGRVTVERGDAQHEAHPASRGPQHVVITVQQAPALPAAPSVEEPPSASEAHPDAPREVAGQPVHVLPMKPAPAAPAAPQDALRLDGLSIKEAVLLVRAAHPAASSTEIAQHLAQHGIKTSGGYVRTALKRAEQQQDGGYL